MFLEILIAVAASAVLTAALLLVVRSRLARQFDDVQRRLVEVERTTHALRMGVERSTTSSQLQRLHLGLVRLHEDVAERFGPLAPLAEKMAAGKAGRVYLSDYEMAGLRDWSSRLGESLEVAQIERWCREIEQVEADNGRTAPLATHELLAIVIALLPLRGQSGLSVVVAGDSGPILALILSHVVAGFLDQARISAAGNGACDVMISNVPAQSLELLKEGGTFVTFGFATSEEPVPGLEVVEAEWNVRVYRTPKP